MISDKENAVLTSACLVIKSGKKKLEIPNCIDVNYQSVAMITGNLNIVLDICQGTSDFDKWCNILGLNATGHHFYGLVFIIVVVHPKVLKCVCVCVFVYSALMSMY